MEYIAQDTYYHADISLTTYRWMHLPVFNNFFPPVILSFLISE
jgi:hypothetical protein